jgi:hypothetical protein
MAANDQHFWVGVREAFVTLHHFHRGGGGGVLAIHQMNFQNGSKGSCEVLCSLLGL